MMKSTPSNMDDIYEHVIEYGSYWLSIYFVLTLNEVIGSSIFVTGGNIKTEHWMWWILNFLITFEYRIITFIPRENLDNITNMIWCWRICRKDNQFVSYSLNVSYFIEYGSLSAVIMWTLLHMTVIFWIEITSMTCFTVVALPPPPPCL